MLKQTLAILIFSVFLIGFVSSIEIGVNANSEIRAGNNTQVNTNTETQIRTQERIRIYSNESDCPENCTCSGSTTKCRIGENREMTIRAGNSGNTIVQVKEANMSTNVTLYRENNSVYGQFRNQNRTIIMPDEVQARIQERINARINNTEIELREDGNYYVQTQKQSRLFLLFPVREKIQLEINAENGEILRVRNPWWGFLAKDETN